MWLLLGLAAFLGLQVWLFVDERRSVRRELADIDAACGLALEPEGRHTARGGMVDGCRVVLEHVRRSGGRGSARLTVTLPTPLPIAVEPERDGVRRVLIGPDLELGCPAFDELARLTGDEVMLRALLFAQTRAALEPLLRSGGRFDGATVTVAWGSRDPGWPARFALDAGKALRAAAAGVSEPVGHLSQIAERDPIAGIRAATVDCMVRRFPDDLRTARVLDSALTDADPAVRLAAARPLQHDETLEGLLAPEVPEAQQVAAVAALIRSPDGLQRVEARLGGLRGEARRAAVRALRLGGRALDGGLALADVEAGRLALHGSEQEP